MPTPDAPIDETPDALRHLRRLAAAFLVALS